MKGTVLFFLEKFFESSSCQEGRCPTWDFVDNFQSSSLPHQDKEGAFGAFCVNMRALLVSRIRQLQSQMQRSHCTGAGAVATNTQLHSLRHGCPYRPPSVRTNSLGIMSSMHSTVAGAEAAHTEGKHGNKTAANAVTEETAVVAGSALEQELFAALPTNESSPHLLKTRHTASHVMAMAVQRIRKDAQITIGPWIDDGFYYDFYLPPPSEEAVAADVAATETGNAEDGESVLNAQRGKSKGSKSSRCSSNTLSDGHLKAIKKEMDRIIKADLPLVKEEVSRVEALRRIQQLDNNEPYKLEILDAIKTEPITIYHCGDEWWDLCAGPHLESTGQLNVHAIELQSVAGAYWRGDENNQMLQRIYGTAWENNSQLKLYKRRLEEAKRRDHRTVGKKLNLFSIQEDAGGGLVFWHEKGSRIRRIIEDYWKQAHMEAGYEMLYSPHIANIDLWKTSGHFDFYHNDMFKPMLVDNTEYQIRPMNCPFHCLVYKDTSRSYKDLPLRMAELGTVYRYERSGTLHGLFRVRGFTQDDAHIFCLPSQLEDEIVAVLNLTESILEKFGFQSQQFKVMLSTRPEESVGNDYIWDKATQALIGALERKNWPYTVDEGGGAFYGPKIDVKIQDAIGRLWQCSTIQADFNLPERFNMEYTASDGEKERPIMLHRAIFGSLERFFGILIENTAGEFPLWLAPTQLRLIPVTDDREDVYEYCLNIKKQAAKLGIRCDIDNSSNRLSKKIRNSEIEKLPVVAVIGDQEVSDQTISVRVRAGGKGSDAGTHDVQDLLQSLQNAITDAVGAAALGNYVAPTVPEASSSSE